MPPYSTSAATRSGWDAAKTTLIGTLSEAPNTAARSDPAASITARISSLRSSSVGTPATRSDRPVPRLSNRSTRMLGKTTQESSPACNLPDQLHVGDPGGRDDHIKRALAQHLVGDHDIPTARITCLGHVHGHESGSPATGAQESCGTTLSGAHRWPAFRGLVRPQCSQRTHPRRDRVPAMACPMRKAYRLRL